MTYPRTLGHTSGRVNIQGPVVFSRLLAPNHSGKITLMPSPPQVIPRPPIDSPLTRQPQAPSPCHSPDLFGWSKANLGCTWAVPYGSWCVCQGVRRGSCCLCQSRLCDFVKLSSPNNKIYYVLESRGEGKHRDLCMCSQQRAPADAGADVAGL